MTKLNWGDKLKKMGILWQHDGDCNKPHALWTSGRHANTFNNGSKLVENPKMLEEVAAGIIQNIQQQFKGEKPDWVVGPAFGAVTLGHEVARQLETKFAFTEPVEKDGEKMQILKRFSIGPGEKVLVVEDAISTGGSILKTIDVLEKVGADILPYVATVVNWSGDDKLKERKILALFSDKPKSWTAEECELCKCGSKPLRPKANWHKFQK